MANVLHVDYDVCDVKCAMCELLGFFIFWHCVDEKPQLSIFNVNKRTLTWTTFTRPATLHQSSFVFLTHQKMRKFYSAFETLNGKRDLLDPLMSQDTAQNGWTVAGSSTKYVSQHTTPAHFELPCHSVPSPASVVNFIYFRNKTFENMGHWKKITPQKECFLAA